MDGIIDVVFGTGLIQSCVIFPFDQGEVVLVEDLDHTVEVVDDIQSQHSEIGDDVISAWRVWLARVDSVFKWSPFVWPGRHPSVSQVIPHPFCDIVRHSAVAMRWALIITTNIDRVID